MKFFLYFLLIFVLNTPKTSFSEMLNNNLTSFNGDINSLNNNSWNNSINERSVNANFGNCNSIILRCAQPKCASGGCLAMEIVQPIVEACVMTNDACKNYGEALIKSISGQIVAKQTAKENEKNARNNQEAQEQTNRQMQEMQNQINQQVQSLQQQMADQRAESEQKIQQALAEQKTEFENNQKNFAEQNNAQPVKSEEEIEKATEKGISADTLLREQASGQILAKIESAETALKAVKKSMQNVFDYAKCDRNGNNCEGPKRITAFKSKTEPFFDSYDLTLDSLEDAIMTSMTLGVNLTDIYMMLNGGCNMWGKFVCGPSQHLRYAYCGDKYFEAKNKSECNNCTDDGKENEPCPPTKTENGKLIIGKSIGCNLIGNISTKEQVQSEWLYSETNDNKNIQIACLSDAVSNFSLFKRRNKKSNIDIDILQDILNENPKNKEQCYENNIETYLEKWTKSRTLPNNICIKNLNN